MKRCTAIPWAGTAVHCIRVASKNKIDCGLKDTGTAEPLILSTPLPRVLVILPKLPDVYEAVGRPKAGVLVMLKASNRPSRVNAR